MGVEKEEKKRKKKRRQVFPAEIFQRESDALDRYETKENGAELPICYERSGFPRSTKFPPACFPVGALLFLISPRRLCQTRTRWFTVVSTAFRVWRSSKKRKKKKKRERTRDSICWALINIQLGSVCHNVYVRSRLVVQCRRWWKELAIKVAVVEGKIITTSLVRIRLSRQRAWKNTICSFAVIIMLIRINIQTLNIETVYNIM